MPPGWKLLSPPIRLHGIHHLKDGEYSQSVSTHTFWVYENAYAVVQKIQSHTSDNLARASLAAMRREAHLNSRIFLCSSDDPRDGKKAEDDAAEAVH
mmetsp:Transcript_25554/g.51960  ORF Transcript_25554/g.51960 Transcript_25554/m.51960 type:complete len:97 (+) Transcript_25554:163-453(+)